MSDNKPDQILAEESDDPWVKLILWTQKVPSYPAMRWNGFMKYLVEEGLKDLKPLNLTEEQRLGFMKRWRADSAELKYAPPLSAAALEYAKKFILERYQFWGIGVRL